ncbi:MAG TPA: AraC family transcriptional regulator [Verrucomicrobiae bacterium]
MYYPAVAKAREHTRFLISLYHTPPEASRAVFYSVVRAGHLIAGRDHRIERDHYPGHELILCLRGRGFVRIGGREHAVEPGALAWVNCYHPHAYWADAAAPWELYWVRVEGPGLDRLCQILSADRMPVISGLRVSEARAVFERTFKHLQGHAPEAAALVHAEIARLIALLFQARLRAGGVTAGETEVPLHLQKPIQTMRLYFHRPLRVAELAAQAGMSDSTFMRAFKRVMGTSPIDWLRRERINQAKRRLIESADSVKEVARQAGYSDQFFFSKDFKKFTGLAPTEFRRRECGPA